MNSLVLILSDRRYFAISWVFCSLNIIVGTWVLYIPYVKDKLSLNDSQIGLALFCLALGVLSFLPLTSYITKKVGLGKYTIIGISLFSIAFIIPLLATNYVTLCSALFIVGAFSGSTDVAMNTLVSEMEKKDHVNFMSSANGFFSLGGAIGAFLGSFIMTFVFKPFYHMGVMAIIILGINLLLCKQYLSIVEEEVSSEAEEAFSFQSLRLLKPLFLIAFVAFVIMSSEGAIENWSTLYLLEEVKIETRSFAGAGFIIFSIAMTLGRFFGDMISDKIGLIKVVLFGCFFSIIGYSLVIFSKIIISTIGFGIIGIGLSVIIPELFRVAGKMEIVSTSKAISFVSGIGFIGFLLGPVVLGYISSHYGLNISFIVLLVLMFIALIVTLFNDLRNSN